MNYEPPEEKPLNLTQFTIINEYKYVAAYKLFTHICLIDFCDS